MSLIRKDQAPAGYLDIGSGVLMHDGDNIDGKTEFRRFNQLTWDNAIQPLIDLYQ